MERLPFFIDTCKRNPLVCISFRPKTDTLAV